GPSNPRDTVGLVVDGFLDPLNYLAANNDAAYAPAIRGFVDGIDKRSRVLDVLDEIERTSLDFYATIRSLYRQRRVDEVNDGMIGPEIPGPSILSEDGDEPLEFTPDRAEL
ncbi:MAG: MlaA family lipoprotein, partial [Alphaproteobacteria bacterium]